MTVFGIEVEEEEAKVWWDVGGSLEALSRVSLLYTLWKLGRIKNTKGRISFDADGAAVDVDITSRRFRIIYDSYDRCFAASNPEEFVEKLSRYGGTIRPETFIALTEKVNEQASV